MASEKTLSYRGYLGSIVADPDEEILHGRIEFINDLVTYEAVDLPSLKKEFEAAVDDYLQTCADLNKEPDKCFSGTLNVRIGAERHRRMALKAAKRGASLNEELTRALDQYLEGGKTELHMHFETVREENLTGWNRGFSTSKIFPEYKKH